MQKYSSIINITTDMLFSNTEPFLALFFPHPDNVFRNSAFETTPNLPHYHQNQNPGAVPFPPPNQSHHTIGDNPLPRRALWCQMLQFPSMFRGATSTRGGWIVATAAAADISKNMWRRQMRLMSFETNPAHNLHKVSAVLTLQLHLIPAAFSPTVSKPSFYPPRVFRNVSAR